jgi:hypothetical protein
MKPSLLPRLFLAGLAVLLLTLPLAMAAPSPP